MIKRPTLPDYMVELSEVVCSYCGCSSRYELYADSVGGLEIRLSESHSSDCIHLKECDDE